MSVGNRVGLPDAAADQPTLGLLYNAASMEVRVLAEQLKRERGAERGEGGLDVVVGVAEGEARKAGGCTRAWGSRKKEKRRALRGREGLAACP